MWRLHHLLTPVESMSAGNDFAIQPRDTDLTAVGMSGQHDCSVTCAQLQRTWSSYRETRDNYRMTVLNAFKDVENGMSVTARLRSENDRLKKAVQAAMQTQKLTMVLYKGGADNYLEALIAQVSTLDARINQAQVQSQALQSTVRLVRALGGGWQDKMLPTPDQTMTFDVLQYDNLHHPAAAGGITTVKPENFENLTGQTK